MSFVPFGVDSSLKCFVLYLQKGGREGGRGVGKEKGVRGRGNLALAAFRGMYVYAVSKELTIRLILR